MIYLHQFRPKFNIPNLSPFCLKVETWLKMAELDFEVRYGDDPSKGPLGKFPVIDDGGNLVPDSTMIIEYLQKKYHVDLDASLSNEEKAISHAFQRMMEERLYWACVYNRWIDSNWSMVKKGVFGKLPPIVRNIVPPLVQRKIRRDLQGQGLGRHEQETLYRFACSDIDALAEYMGDKPYFMGANMTTIDAVLYGFLCGIIRAGFDSPMNDRLKKHQNLLNLEAKIGRQYFPEYY